VPRSSTAALSFERIVEAVAVGYLSQMIAVAPATCGRDQRASFSNANSDDVGRADACVDDADERAARVRERAEPRLRPSPPGGEPLSPV
jgi:hypothetical protein